MLCCYYQEPTVIALCETWLTDNAPLKLHNIAGYQPNFVKRGQAKRERLWLVFHVDYEVRLGYSEEFTVEFGGIKCGKLLEKLLVYRATSLKFMNF